MTEKKVFFRIEAIVLLCAVLFANTAAEALLHIRPLRIRDAGSPKWVPGEIVVKFRQGVTSRQVEEINRRHGVCVLYTSHFGGFKRLKIPAGKTPHEIVAAYSQSAEVLYAELNYYAHAMFIPNDPYYYLQWNFNTPSAGIGIEQAWDITTGDPNVIVAVLDTGVAYETYKAFEIAPDLVNTLFVAGYDFVGGDTHANDDDGHGTHVTGTIAQSTNNNLGVAGAAFNCSIMPVKVLNKRGEAPYTTIAEGIYYAANNGADIINMSLGGPSDASTLRDAVAYAWSLGITIVCSGGNEFQYGNPPSYPAAYDDYCIAVAATRFDRTRAPYSNTGSYIDIAAPGGDLDLDQNGDGYGDGILQQTFGLNPKDWGYWFYVGTSMAAPHVTATAALLHSTGITDVNMVRAALLNTAVDIGPAGWDEQFGWGFLNPYGALNYINIPGDFNGDGSVNYRDLAEFAAYWLGSEESIDIAPPAQGDGIINFLDFSIMADNWLLQVMP
ncbi:MAG: S8 family serine peptidase [Planctomycetota bacterium]